MKVKVLAMIVCSVVAGSAMGQNSDSLNNVRQNVSESESHYSEAERQYHDAAYELGSAVNGSSAEAHLNQMGAERAQAYGEEYNAERAADYQQKQQEAKDALAREAQRTEAQAVAKADAVMNSYEHPVTPSKAFGDAQVKANQQRTENQAVALADARMDAQERQDKSLGQATHKTNEKHEGPLHATASARPAAAHATGSHLDSSSADKEAANIAQDNAAKNIPGLARAQEARRTEAQAVAKADAVMNSYDHPVTPSKAFGDAQVKANQQRTENQAVALADARMDAQDRQDKALGQATHKTNERHQSPLHVTASARPAAAHATGAHLDSSSADKEAAKIAQNDAAKRTPDQAQLARFNIDRTSQQTQDQAQAQELSAHTMRFAGMSKQPAIALSAAKPAAQAIKLDSKPYNASINVAANSLNPNTKVTLNGKPTTAGALKPDTQVSVGINSAFIHTAKGNNSRGTSTNRHEHGTGNGADNAHESAFGGHAHGGGFHY